MVVTVSGSCGAGPDASGPHTEAELGQDRGRRGSSGASSPEPSGATVVTAARWGSGRSSLRSGTTRFTVTLAAAAVATLRANTATVVVLAARIRRVVRPV